MSPERRHDQAPRSSMRLICIECPREMRVVSAAIGRVVACIWSRANFDVREYQVHIFGRCHTCVARVVH